MNQEQFTTKVEQQLAQHFSASDDCIKFWSPRADARHFELIIQSKQFDNLSKLQRHQLVYKILANYLENQQIHALSMVLKDSNSHK